MACLLLCEYKLRRKHAANNCIQQLTSESVRLIYSSGSNVPKNLFRSWVVLGYCWSIIRPAGAFSDVYVLEDVVVGEREGKGYAPPPKKKKTKVNC